ncbi:hypothetical protein [Nocardia asiatica]|uniref:hypothetical protein n=1 Tax=Nocardia asiatica TaxID=209252 RepID=UPI002455463A|nr:hypothetical protein [Nocardia asiatica]
MPHSSENPGERMVSRGFGLAYFGVFVGGFFAGFGWLLSWGDVGLLMVWLTFIALFVVAGVGLIVVGNLRAREYARQQKEGAVRRDQLERIEHNRQVQESLRSTLQHNTRVARDLFVQMPQLLAAAERSLDHAEQHFGDGAFFPFWDSVEEAMRNLGRFAESADEIRSSAQTYQQAALTYLGVTEPFSVSLEAVTKLQVGEETSARMDRIVLQAHRVYEFANIYGQKRTHAILIAGFTELGNAISNMSAHLALSLDQLQASVTEMNANLGSRLDDTRYSHQQLHQQVVSAASDQMWHQKEAMKLLDDIRRGHKPLL